MIAMLIIIKTKALNLRYLRSDTQTLSSTLEVKQLLSGLHVVILITVWGNRLCRLLVYLSVINCLRCVLPSFLWKFRVYLAQVFLAFYPNISLLRNSRLLAIFLDVLNVFHLFIGTNVHALVRWFVIALVLKHMVNVGVVLLIVVHHLDSWCYVRRKIFLIYFNVY
jgi:hypothetical protein